jgi:hypothetical protein
MFPFIIQLPQVPTCCAIQLAIWPHHAGEAGPPLVEPEPSVIHCWHVVCSAEALPHIVAPVICPLRSCWPIQSVIAEHQAVLGEPLPRVGAELPDHCWQDCCTDVSCADANCWLAAVPVEDELLPRKTTIPTPRATSKIATRPAASSHVLERLALRWGGVVVGIVCIVFIRPVSVGDRCRR